MDPIINFAKKYIEQKLAQNPRANAADKIQLQDKIQRELLTSGTPLEVIEEAFKQLGMVIPSVKEYTVSVSSSTIPQERVADAAKAVFPSLVSSGSDVMSLRSIERKVQNIVPGDTKKYVSHFLDEVIQLLEKNGKKDEAAKVIAMLADVPIKLNEIYPVEEFGKPIGESRAKNEWSSGEESARQKKAKEYAENVMYDALAVVESAIMGINVAKVHKDICKKIAHARAKEITIGDEVHFTNEFSVKVPKENGEPVRLKGMIETKQLGAMRGSMVDRITPAPVNLQTETATFQLPDGDSVRCTQLRSGSFDMDRIPISEEELEFPKYELDEYAEEYQSFVAAVKADIVKTYIDQIRTLEDPESMAKLIMSIKLFKHNFVSKSLSFIDSIDLQKEWREQKINQITIQANKQAIKEMLARVEAYEEGGERLGFVFPRYVQEAFNEDELFNGSSWGMVSLQTPANITASEDSKLNAFIKKHANKLPDAIAKLNEPEMSEMLNILREMQAFEETLMEEELTGFYFNIPTNFLGATQVIKLASMEIYKFKPVDFFTVGVVAQARLKRIQDITNRSLRRIYDLSDKAIELLTQKAASLEGRVADPKELMAVKRYIEALKQLREDTFTVTKEGNIELKDKPGSATEYESVGRLNVLMQMLNINTTFHCRSGNNRTASEAAQSHQLVADFTASPTGRISPPTQTAGTLAGAKEDHWSLKVRTQALENSIRLQMANKGKAGTKEGHKELGNKAYQNAYSGGNFEIAGAFNQRLMGFARLRYMDALREAKATKENVEKAMKYTLMMLLNKLTDRSRSGLLKDFSHYLYDIPKDVGKEVQGATFASQIKDLSPLIADFHALKAKLPIKDPKQYQDFDKKAQALLKWVSKLKENQKLLPMIREELDNVSNEVANIKEFSSFALSFQKVRTNLKEITQQSVEELYARGNELKRQFNKDPILSKEIDKIINDSNDLLKFSHLKEIFEELKVSKNMEDLQTFVKTAQQLLSDLALDPKVAQEITKMQTQSGDIFEEAE